MAALFIPCIANVVAADGVCRCRYSPRACVSANVLSWPRQCDGIGSSEPFLSAELERLGAATRGAGFYAQGHIVCNAQREGIRNKAMPASPNCLDLFSIYASMIDTANPLTFADGTSRWLAGRRELKWTGVVSVSNVPTAAAALLMPVVGVTAATKAWMGDTNPSAQYLQQNLVLAPV